MAQTRPSPTLSRGFTRVGRFLALYAFDVKRLSAAAESTGIHLSPLESTRFMEK